MARSVNIVVTLVFFIKNTVTIENYVNSDKLLSKSFGFSLESKSIKLITDSLINKEYLDLYKDMLKLVADDEPYSHVKSRNVLMPMEKERDKDHRRRRSGHTLELIAHRRNKYQAARRERLVRQSQDHKRKASKRTNHTNHHKTQSPAHKHKMHHVHKKQQKPTSSV